MSATHSRFGPAAVKSRSGYRVVDTGLPRSAGVWGGSAVRAILTNPRYLGHQVADRQRRYDELFSARDPALGTVSRQRWQPRDDWAWSEQQSWPALVSKDLFDRVNRRITNTVGNGAHRPRAQPGQYLFSGAIRCARCGKAMSGNTAKNKAYYRCSATRPDYAKPSVPDHPPTYMVREERLVAAVDGWLDTLTHPEHIDATVAAVIAADRSVDAEPAEVTQARRRRERLELELKRMLAAIRAGMDPTLAAKQTRQIQTDIASARYVVEEWAASHQPAGPLDPSAVRDALAQAGGLVVMLLKADRVDKAALYRELGLTLRYEKQAATGEERVLARLQLWRGGGGI